MPRTQVQTPVAAVFIKKKFLPAGDDKCDSDGSDDVDMSYFDECQYAVDLCKNSLTSLNGTGRDYPPRFLLKNRSEKWIRKHFPEAEFGKIGSTFGFDLETGKKVHMFRGIVIGECIQRHVYLVAFPLQEYVGYFTDREDITDFGVEGDIPFLASDFKVVTGYVDNLMDKTSNNLKAIKKDPDFKYISLMDKFYIPPGMSLEHDVDLCTETQIVTETPFEDMPTQGPPSGMMSP